MFHKYLEHDLTKIFGLKKVVWSNVEHGAEQNVLYVDISNQRNRPRDGYYYIKVFGELGFNTQYGNTKKGWFHYKWLDSKYDHKNRLQLSGVENNTNFGEMNKYFCKNRIEFVYTIKIPFNPSKPTKGFLGRFYTLIKGGKSGT